jgi:DNA-binding transcriptional regulator YiaG
MYRQRGSISMTTTTPPALTPLEALRELHTAINDDDRDQLIPDGIYAALCDAERTIQTYSWDSETIKAARTSAGLSQVQLAKALGCNPATVEAWERGHRLPSDEHRNKLTQLFSDQENER